jgi:hypothetical protein
MVRRPPGRALIPFASRLKRDRRTLRGGKIRRTARNLNGRAGLYPALLQTARPGQSIRKDPS